MVHIRTEDGVKIIIPNSTKNRGRPRKFDEASVLDAAVEVFWLRGYDGASLDDLTDAMGLNRPSLYRAFGDKKGLYLASLQHYAGGIGSAGMRAFEAEADIASAVRAMLVASLECQTRDGDRAQGCLLGTCCPATLASVPEASAFLKEVSNVSQQILSDRFEGETRSGHVTSKVSPDARASLLLDFIQSQAYRARIGESREDLAAAINEKVNIVLRVA